ncbi:MAG: hypothetical protein KF863_11195 [Rubrivivax sp.]|nr:hypothetical protein [Rubrivivax sp.]
MWPGERPDAATLLQLADAVLRSAAPAWTTTFHHYGTAYRVRFEYPGRVLVYVRATGEPVARSRLGQPTKPERERRARTLRLADR